MTKKSPLAPASFPNLLPVAGVRLGAASAGIRYQGRDSSRHDCRWRVYPIANRVGTRGMVSESSRKWCSSGIGCEFGQLIGFHRTGGAQNGQTSGGRGCKADWVPAN